MIEDFYIVSYFDTRQGGCGLAHVRKIYLDTWLAEHPGYLIRELVSVQ